MQFMFLIFLYEVRASIFYVDPVAASLHFLMSYILVSKKMKGCSIYCPLLPRGQFCELICTRVGSAKSSLQ